MSSSAPSPFNFHRPLPTCNDNVASAETSPCLSTGLQTEFATVFIPWQKAVKDADVAYPHDAIETLSIFDFKGDTARILAEPAELTDGDKAAITAANTRLLQALLARDNSSLLLQALATFVGKSRMDAEDASNLSLEAYTLPDQFSLLETLSTHFIAKRLGISTLEAANLLRNDLAFGIVEGDSLSAGMSRLSKNPEKAGPFFPAFAAAVSPAAPPCAIEYRADMPIAMMPGTRSVASALLQAGKTPWATFEAKPVGSCGKNAVPALYGVGFSGAPAEYFDTPLTRLTRGWLRKFEFGVNLWNGGNLTGQLGITKLSELGPKLLIDWKRTAAATYDGITLSGFEIGSNNALARRSLGPNAADLDQYLNRIINIVREQINNPQAAFDQVVKFKPLRTHLTLFNLQTWMEKRLQYKNEPMSILFYSRVGGTVHHLRESQLAYALPDESELYLSSEELSSKETQLYLITQSGEPRYRLRSHLNNPDSIDDPDRNHYFLYTLDGQQVRDSHGNPVGMLQAQNLWVDPNDYKHFIDGHGVAWKRFFTTQERDTFKDQSNALAYRDERALATVAKELKDTGRPHHRFYAADISQEMELILMGDPENPDDFEDLRYFAMSSDFNHPQETYYLILCMIVARVLHKQLGLAFHAEHPLVQDWLRALKDTFGIPDTLVMAYVEADSHAVAAVRRQLRAHFDAMIKQGELTVVDYASPAVRIFGAIMQSWAMNIPDNQNISFPKMRKLLQQERQARQAVPQRSARADQ